MLCPRIWEAVNSVSKASDLFWYPSEVDVSIRPGWFYHAEQDNQVRYTCQLGEYFIIVLWAVTLFCC